MTELADVPFLDVRGSEFRPDSPQVAQARAVSWAARTSHGFAILRYEEAAAMLAGRFMADFVEPCPARIICEPLGIPRERQAALPGAANRDPAVFGADDGFDITVRRPASRLTLGDGIGDRLGAALARADMAGALAIPGRRLPGTGAGRAHRAASRRRHPRTAHTARSFRVPRLPGQHKELP